MQDQPPGFVPRLIDSGRYRLLSPLGEGGMGLVYLAHDTMLGRDLALKTLRSHSPDEVYQLKKEFRALASLSHPNLVQLYDLVVLDDQCFFTMELVDGVDLVRALRREVATDAAAIDYVRVRDAFHQLSAGLHALHGQGTLHRDIKPANILVEHGGRVVLLDFGLASSLDSDASRRSRAGSFAGTLAYMSPEQIAGRELSAAADWYSVGLVLYECLTGRNPFDGPSLLSAVDRVRREPAPPRAAAPETPADLDALAADLLQLAPERRPSGAQLLERLKPARRQRPLEPQPRPPAAVAEPPFVGRAVELEALRTAFTAARDGLVSVGVAGASGIGKTALVEHFLAGVAAGGEAIVLRARCHPKESIPFQAVDGAIDDLTRFLVHRSDDELRGLLPPNVGALARIFPVLGRVPLVGDSLAAEDRGREPQEVRRRAFHALRSALGRIAERRPLVLWIDDLQWGDLDSIALLRALRAPPDPPQLLLLLSFRSGDEQAPAVTRLLEGDDAGAPRRVEVGAFGAAEVRELARAVLVAEGHPADEATLAAVVREAGGSAFLTCELARHFVQQGQAPRLQAGGLLARRVTDLPELDRRLLEVVAVAGAPVPEELVYKLTGTRETIGRALARLHAERLLRTTVVGEQHALAAYHDRVRETIVRRLSVDAYRDLHRELAAAFAALPDCDPQRLVEHYFEANDLARAGEQAFVSAERAFEALAFEQAARLYRRAIDLGASARPRWVLQARLGETLANLGVGGDAADAFLAAAEDLATRAAGDPEVSRLERQAAEHYLRSGRYDDGLRVLRGVLDRVGLRYVDSNARVIASLLTNRFRLWLRQHVPGARPRPRADAAAAERLEVCWSAGLGLGVADTLRSADYQTQHALLADAAGDVGHRARALAIEALLMVWEGGRRKRDRAARLRVESERLASASADANVVAYGMVLRTVGAFFERRLGDAVALAERAEAFCRNRCVAVAWELANVQTIAVSARVLRGDLASIGQRIDATLREARERGDQYCLLMIRAGYCSLGWLAVDEVEEAERQARAALTQPFPAAFTWPIYQGALAEAHVALYRGDAATALPQLERAWQRLNAGSMLRLQTVRVEIRELRARSAILAAAAGGSTEERRRLLRRAGQDLRRLRREDLPWATPFIEALDGQIAALIGDAATARDQLERAALGFEHLDMGLHAAAVRHQLAPLLVGPAGARLRTEQANWMRDHGIRNPARMAAMLAPWTPAG